MYLPSAAICTVGKRAQGLVGGEDKEKAWEAYREWRPWLDEGVEKGVREHGPFDALHVSTHDNKWLHENSGVSFLFLFFPFPSSNQWVRRF